MFKTVFLSFIFHFIIVHSMFYSRKSIKRLQGDLDDRMKEKNDYLKSKEFGSDYQEGDIILFKVTCLCLSVH